MKTVTIAEFKRQLPALLGEVAKGESVVLQKGRKRENVAILAPFKAEPVKARQLGLLAKRGKPVFKDWSISEEEFLTSR
jgi:antitoxin (DNA-binding transcriptional repressor) of toxin-antitoxin stability system